MSSSSPQYSVTFVNNSANSVVACIYHTPPDMPNAQPIAWLAAMAAPSARHTFQWTIDYAFTWAETGELVPGVVFEDAQTCDTDLTTNNAVTLTRTQGEYTFVNMMEAPKSGSPYITEDSSVGLAQASVGIAMSGAGVFAVEAEPNLNLVFTPHPEYWIAFGKFGQGQVLDLDQLASPSRISFPAGVFAMTATLYPNNTWTIAPG